MDEYEVAIEKVLPYIIKFGWPKELITDYGRVPIQIGTSTKWADFVCYVSINQKAIPWLLFEVKQPGDPLENALPQAESYSLILGTPFFCVTNGNEFDFYLAGDTQGKNIKIQDPPPLPSEEYLSTDIDLLSFPPNVDNLIELFFVGLEQDPILLDDTRYHDEVSKGLNLELFQEIDSLSPEEVKKILNVYVMSKPPNMNMISEQIDEDFDKFKKFLKFIRDFSGDPVIKINQLIEKDGDLHVKGGGIFFVTQLLAGAHLDEYVVLEEKVSKALRYLGITDILVKNDTANGYVYINNICKKLYKDKLEFKLKDYDIGLAAVHNFLWHYYDSYRIEKKWL